MVLYTLRCIFNVIIRICSYSFSYLPYLSTNLYYLIPKRHGIQPP